MSRARLGVLLAGCVLFAGGCGSDRRIFISSEPSGALVYLNDQEVGRTPVEVNFTYFGVYDVRLRREGYEPLITRAEAKPPLHEQPGFDLIAMLIPGRETTEIAWHFVLSPTDDDVDALWERAAELRAMFGGEAGPGGAADASDGAVGGETPARTRDRGYDGW